MAGLRTSVQLEAIETLDSHGMPGELLVQELTLDLDKESAYSFAKKLNKRVQIVLQYADNHDVMEEVLNGAEDGSDEEGDDKKPAAKPSKAKGKKAGEDKEQVHKEAGDVKEADVVKEEKSVEDLLNEIV